ncbi:hypothetical protein ACMBCN_02585 [Candidatus Liberibacter asiaticus]|nr:hypothetical protein [Candidatus Liberibacter asiaticus]
MYDSFIYLFYLYILLLFFFIIIFFIEQFEKFPKPKLYIDLNVFNYVHNQSKIKNNTKSKTHNN